MTAVLVQFMQSSIWRTA